MKITEKIELRNCCNMDLMSEYDDNHFDLAIVDPPYGGNDAINIQQNKDLSKQAANRGEFKQFKNEEPDEEYFKELFRVSKNQIIWGANFYTKINLSGGMICWD